MQNSTESIIRNILLNQITGLISSNIWIESQNREIPNDEDALFVIVGLQDAVPISNRNRTEFPEGGTFQEIQEISILENIQIELISRDTKALLQRWEVLTALNSIYAQQQQEKYNFKIAKISASLANTTEAEGGSQLNRFTIVIPCHVWYRKVKEIASNDYYDTFDTRVDDESTIGKADGLIEFTIDETTEL